MASFRKAYLLKQRIAGNMLKKNGVHGVGVGLRDPRHPKRGAAIIVYADALSTAASSKKKATSKRTTALPRYLKPRAGVPFRVVRSPRFCKRGGSENGSKFTRRIRPVVAGYSVGTADSSGTVGLIVSSDPSGCSRLILSNNHVLVDNNTRRFSATLQPGGADGGTAAHDRIGQLERFTKLSQKRANYLDAATARPFRRSLLKPAYAVFGIVPGHVRTYKVGDQFKKVGRTTGVVTGQVESIHTDVQVDYGDYGNLGTITFKDQSVIRGKRPVSLEGDSGSVWLTRKGNLAAAVNFAGSENGMLSISYPIEWFMQVFGARVARPGSRGLQRAQRGKNGKYMCIRPLPAKLVKSLRPITAPSRPLRQRP
ncbi:MAG: hypothetical protein E6Y08_06940 [Paenibacillus sp.]|uniref:hypothetical protein n=1 Tax=Paenibacillus sp. TaxID=58172 RepID=UPI002906F88B|nr:hypothetical protein [Paenibacillus sp.]MDU4695533.1 hypothetical protein [Paenibacillus sp.]